MVLANKNKSTNRIWRSGFVLTDSILTNELELVRFNKLYADYDFKLKEVWIDARLIIEGNVCSCATKVLKIEKKDELNSEIGN